MLGLTLGYVGHLDLNVGQLGVKYGVPYRLQDTLQSIGNPKAYRVVYRRYGTYSLYGIL